MFTALLDTCVLWPNLQRDFLLSLAIQGLYRPMWNSEILTELQYHEARKLQDPIRFGFSQSQAESRADRLIDQMQAAFPDAQVKGWEPLEGTYGLPDQDDEHVVAAAHLGGAGVIVTENLKDFPPSHLPAGIDTACAKEFVFTTVSISPRAALAAVTEISKRSGHHGPTRTVTQIMEILEKRYNLADSISLIRTVRT